MTTTSLETRMMMDFIEENWGIALGLYVLVWLLIAMIVATYSRNKYMGFVPIGIGIVLIPLLIGWKVYHDKKVWAQRRKESAENAKQQRLRDAEEQAEKEKNYATIYNYTDYVEGGECKSFWHDKYGKFDHAAYECVDGKITRKAKYKDFNEQCLPGHTRKTRIACDESGQTYIDR